MIDLPQRAVQVFRDPGAGGYETSFTATGDASVSASLLPAVVVLLPALFTTQE